LFIIRTLAKRNPEANPCELACARKIHPPAARQAAALFLIAPMIAVSMAPPAGQSHDDEGIEQAEAKGWGN
jgi:hypothetical protein